jgi:hypothetical protein
MTDIFICYASEDRATCERIVEALRPEWNIWIDDDIVGRFTEQIQQAIRNCKCVLAFWSEISATKDLVRAELDYAKKLGRQIIPVRLEECDGIWGYEAFSRVDLIDWNGDVVDRDYRLLTRKIAQVIPPKTAPVRPATIGAMKLELPTIFLSVSSFETQLIPVEALKVLRVGQYPAVLVSAYDLPPGPEGRKMRTQLKRYRKNGGFVLVDSGNYESTRLNDQSWTPARLAKTLRDVDARDWAFCFDTLDPKWHGDRAAREVIDAVRRDEKRSNCPVLPIVHARRKKGGGFRTEELPQLAVTLAEQLHPAMIAFPERELGPGIIERAKTMLAIRKALSTLPYYQPVHLLGTGNPWSIAILCAAGADSFDGLEWCRVAIDRDHDVFNHFQHFDFYSWQTRGGSNDLAKAALEDPNIAFAGKVAFHNFAYYLNLLVELRRHVRTNTFEALFLSLLGKDATSDLRNAVPDLFL